MPNLLEIQKKSYKWFLETGLREVVCRCGLHLRTMPAIWSFELHRLHHGRRSPSTTVEWMQGARRHVCRPHEGAGAPARQGDRRDQGAGDLHGRLPPDDPRRHLRHQRRRARGGQPDRPFPGIYYGKEIDLKTDLPLLTSTVIPYRGAWLEYETDTSEVFWVRIDKNRKLPITCLIRALGLKTDAEILERFGDDRRSWLTLEKDTCKTYEEAMLEIYRKLRPGEPPTVDSAETLLQNLFFDPAAMT